VYMAGQGLLIDEISAARGAIVLAVGGKVFVQGHSRGESERGENERLEHSGRAQKESEREGGPRGKDGDTHLSEVPKGADNPSCTFSLRTSSHTWKKSMHLCEWRVR
jgi:hypothetical protein